MEQAPADREEFLRQSCKGDETLARKVRSLLAAQKEAGSFLESPAIEVAAREIMQSGLGGRTISPYKILEKAG